MSRVSKWTAIILLFFCFCFCKCWIVSFCCIFSLVWYDVDSTFILNNNNEFIFVISFEMRAINESHNWTVRGKKINCTFVHCSEWKINYNYFSVFYRISVSFCLSYSFGKIEKSTIVIHLNPYDSIHNAQPFIHSGKWTYTAYSIHIEK